MRKFKIFGLFLASFILVVILQDGFRYSFQDDSELINDLLDKTPLGSNYSEVIPVLNEKYNQNSLLFKGKAMQIENKWTTLGINSSLDLGKIDAPFFYTFRLGSYFTMPSIFRTVVTTTWYFDSNGNLVDIHVFRSADGL